MVTQLALSLDMQPWQMTLAEYTETMAGQMRPKPHGDADNVGERLIDLRSPVDQAYVRVMHKRAIMRARQDGYAVDAAIIAEHPILTSSN